MKSLVFALFMLGFAPSAFALHDYPFAFVCRGDVPGYPYVLVVDSATQITLRSVTSIGQFTIAEGSETDAELISLWGRLKGVQHPWEDQEDREIKMTPGIFLEGDGDLYVSDMHYSCARLRAPPFLF